MYFEPEYVLHLGRPYVSCDRLERLESMQCILWEGREAAHTSAVGCARSAGEMQRTCGVGAAETLRCAGGLHL